MLSLTHLANFNSTNIGNGALIYGLERVVNEDFDQRISWDREPWDEYTFEKKFFDETFVDMVNRQDGLIVGAAVAINGRDYLSNAGMRFDLPLELWKKISRPVVFYGISHRHWPGQPFHHLDKLRAVLHYILDRSDVIFSVRNDGTKEWLEELLGFTDARILTVPDPAVFVPVTDADFPEIVEGRPNIIISLNGEDGEHRFSGRSGGPSEARDRLIVGVAKAMDRIAKDFDANLILVPHYIDDYEMIAAFCRHCSAQVAHQQTVSTGLMRVKDTAYFYGRYSKADLAISMRVHSMSPSIGLGVPTLAIVTQDRMWEFLREAGLDSMMLDGFSPDLADRLYAAAAEALANPELHRDRFAGARKNMRRQSKEFHQKLEALFSD